jgi:uncharacterized protein YqeY
MLRDTLSDAVKAAMRAKQPRRLGTLRLIMAAIKDRDLAPEPKPAGQDRIGDAEILQLLAKMIKQRRESITTYESAGRAELAQQERDEIAIIEEFMPKQMSEAEVRAAVTAAVTEAGAQTVKDMGKVMGILKGRYTGQMDFAKASGVVKDVLK